MPELSYARAGLVLRRGAAGVTERQVRDLQRDLRRLGYLGRGIDGKFGPGTARAVRALQHDLLHNDGRSTAGDGPAPVRVLDYNGDRVSEVTGAVDRDLAACIADMLDDPAFPKLPRAEDPVAANRDALARVAALEPDRVPIPFLLAIFRQESSSRHYNVPRGSDDDSYIVVGLDTNASQKHVITSRGYGLGQYTLFHHPPLPEEVEEFILDPAGNLQKAIAELREKFDHFVVGPTSGTRADDRVAEIGPGPLRPCKYARDDPRHMRDCAACAREAGATEIIMGETPYYAGATHRYRATQYYRVERYRNVPIRAGIGCDWPYAVRRYNGAGVNSYHYQARVLKFLRSG